MRSFFICLVMLSLSVSQATAQDTMGIAALGDSLFAGQGVAEADAYPAQLERKLLQEGYKVHVYNDGVSGDTAAGGLARLDAVLAQHPQLAIVELGANDMLRGIPPEVTAKHLDTILSRLKAAHVRLVVFGQKAPFSYGKHYAQEFDSLFCALAKQHDAPCYPIFLEGVFNEPGMMQVDGIHPTAEGVKIIVEKTWPVVASQLPK